MNQETTQVPTMAAVTRIIPQNRFRAAEESSVQQRRPGTKDYSVYAKRLNLPDLPEFVPLSATEADEDVAAVLPADTRPQKPQLRRRGGDSPGQESPASPRAAPANPEETSSSAIRAYETAVFSGSDVTVPSELELEQPAAVLSGWVTSRLLHETACSSSSSSSASTASNVSGAMSAAQLLQAFPLALGAALAQATTPGVYPRRWRQDAGGSFLVNLAADIGTVPLQLHSLRHAWHAPQGTLGTSGSYGSSAAGFSAHHDRSVIGMASLRLDLSLTQRLEALACRSEERDRRFLLLREDYVDRLRGYLVELHEQEELLVELQRAARERADSVRRAADQNADIAHWLRSIVLHDEEEQVDDEEGKVSSAPPQTKKAMRQQQQQQQQQQQPGGRKMADDNDIEESDTAKNSSDDAAFCEAAEEHAMWRAFMACTGRHITPALAAWAKTEPAQRSSTGHRRLDAPTLSAEEVAHASLLQTQNENLRARLASALSDLHSEQQRRQEEATPTAPPRGGTKRDDDDVPSRGKIASLLVDRGDLVKCPIGCGYVVTQSNKSPFMTAVALSWGATAHVPAADVTLLNRAGEIGGGPMGAVSRGLSKPVSTTVGGGDAASRPEKSLLWGRYGSSARKGAAELQKRRNEAQWLKEQVDATAKRKKWFPSVDDRGLARYMSDNDEDGSSSSSSGSGGSRSDDEDDDDDNNDAIPDGYTPGVPVFRSGWAWGVPRGVPLHLDPSRGSSARGFAVGVVDRSRREGFRPLPQPMLWPQRWLRPVRSKMRSANGGAARKSQQTKRSDAEEDVTPLSQSQSLSVSLSQSQSDGRRERDETQHPPVSRRLSGSDFAPASPTHSGTLAPQSPTSLGHAPLGSPSSDSHGAGRELQQHRAEVRRLQFQLRMSEESCSDQRKRLTQARMNAALLLQSLNDLRALLAQSREDHRRKAHEVHLLRGQVKRAENRFLRAVQRGWTDAPSELLQDAETACDPDAKKAGGNDEDDDGNDDDGNDEEQQRRRGSEDDDSDDGDDRLHSKKKKDAKKRAWRRRQSGGDKWQSESDVSSVSGVREKGVRGSKTSDVDNGGSRFGQETSSLEKEGSGSRKRMRPDNDDSDDDDDDDGEEDEDDERESEAGRSQDEEGSSRSSAKRRRVASSGNGDSAVDAILGLGQREGAVDKQMQGRRRRRRRG